VNPRILQLHLKRVYWEQIRDGIKPEENRERNFYWFKRLENKEYDLIYLWCGYSKAIDKDKLLIRKWNGYKKKKIVHEQFDGLAYVYAIDVTVKP
jgi:hypothetical protein